MQQELDNNAQGILGYVVRWVDQGVGCSKVPDIHNVGPDEDRATLRISSQHIANWLLHGIATEAQVTEDAEAHGRGGGQAERRRPACTSPWRPPMTASPSRRPETWCLKGKEQPSGYTEPLLHAARRNLKRRLNQRKRRPVGAFLFAVGQGYFDASSAFRIASVIAVVPTLVMPGCMMSPVR